MRDYMPKITLQKFSLISLDSGHS